MTSTRTGRDWPRNNWLAPMGTPSQTTPPLIYAHERGRHRHRAATPSRRPDQEPSGRIAAPVAAVRRFPCLRRSTQLSQRVPDFDELLAPGDPEFSASGLKSASLIRLAASPCPLLLLETVAVVSHARAGTAQVGHVQEDSDSGGIESESRVRRDATTVSWSQLTGPAVAGSKTLATQSGMTNQWLAEQGLVSIQNLWIAFHYPPNAAKE